MWQEAGTSPLDEKGRYLKNYPLSLYALTIPGRGLQPLYCCTYDSDRAQVIHFSVGENFGGPAHGWHVCHNLACPECWDHVVLSKVFYAVGYLKAVQYQHPGSSIYQLRYTFIKQHDLTLSDIDDCFKSLGRIIRKAAGVHGAIAQLHNNQVKRDVKIKTEERYSVDYGEPLTRTKLYRAASDLSYLHHLGFNFKDWREAFDTLWHIHVYIIADHYPTELYIHGNQKRPLSRVLTGGPYYGNSCLSIDNNDCFPTERPDGSKRHWTSVEVDQSYNDTGLAYSLYYSYSHATISNFRGLEIQAFRRFKECRKLKLDFIHDKPYEDTAIIQDPDTGQDIEVTVQKRPDPRVEAAFNILRQAYPHIHRVGKFVYRGSEKPPTAGNEDLPSKKKLETSLTLISSQVFKLKTVYKNGTRIPAEGSEFTYKRRDAFITMVWLLEEDNYIPASFSIRLSASIKKAFEKWDERCLDPNLRARDRQLYTSDFEGFKEFEKAGITVDLGHISKARAYKPPECSDFEKFRALTKGFYHACWYSDSKEDFFKILTYSLEPAVGLGTWESNNNPDAELELITDAMKKAGVFKKAHKKRRNHSNLAIGHSDSVKPDEVKYCSNDSDFTSVEKLSWIIEIEDSTYEEDY